MAPPAEEIAMVRTAGSWENRPNSHSGLNRVMTAKTAAGIATIHMAWPTTFGTRSVFPAPSAWETMAPPAEEIAWETTPIMFSSLRATPVTATATVP